MTSLGARLTLIEQAVSRLTDRRGPKLSNELREARARLQRGEAPAPILRDVAELERQARGTGVTAAMAKATLRMIGAGAAYGRKDGQKEVGGTEHRPPCRRALRALRCPPRSIGSTTCSRSTAVPETIPTVQDVIEMRVAELEADLRMVDARLAAVRWGSHTTSRQSGNMSWGSVAFDTASAQRDAADDGTGLAYAVLDHRRQQLLADLADL